MTTAPGSGPASPASAHPKLTVRIPLPAGGWVAADMECPPEPRGAIMFAHGNNSTRFSPRNTFLAEKLRSAGFATVLLDLLTEEEAKDRANFFEVSMLAERISVARAWLERERPKLPVGLFGSGSGAAAAVQSAAPEGSAYFAVVCRGGRLDLARDALSRVYAPTLLIVGSDDEMLVPVNREASRLLVNAVFEEITGAGHLFEEPGMLEIVGQQAVRWFSSCAPVK